MRLVAAAGGRTLALFATWNTATAPYSALSRKLTHHLVHTLAQGSGRLIRDRTDRGVVAVLDKRLATAGYRRAILDSLPPFKRSVNGDETRTFLRDVTSV